MNDSYINDDPPLSAVGFQLLRNMVISLILALDAKQLRHCLSSEVDVNNNRALIGEGKSFY